MEDELDRLVRAFGRAHELSARQTELVLLFASGLSAKEAAAAMGVDARTAAEYLSRTCVKLQVAGRHELIASLLGFALRRPSEGHGATRRRSPEGGAGARGACARRPLEPRRQPSLR